MRVCRLASSTLGHAKMISVLHWAATPNSVQCSRSIGGRLGSEGFRDDSVMCRCGSCVPLVPSEVSWGSGPGVGGVTLLRLVDKHCAPRLYSFFSKVFLINMAMYGFWDMLTFKLQSASILKLLKP
jgi:hypothetical protein